MTAELAEVRDFLAAHAPFDALPGEVLSKLARALEIRYFRQGNTILETGAENHLLFVVRSGAVELRDATGQLLARLGEGEPFGYPSLLTGNRALNNVSALEDTLVYAIPEATFHSLRHDFPELDRFFSQAHAERVRSAAERPRRLDGGAALLATRALELVRRPPVSLPPESSIREGAAVMDRERVSSLLVVAAGRLEGIVTDRDLRSRVLAAGRSGDEPLSAIMTRELVFAQADDYAFEALLAMTRHNIHHLPVLSGDEPIGLLTATDLIHLQTADPIYLVGDIHKQTEVAGLARVCKRLPQLLINLVEADASAYDVGRIVTTVSDALNERLLELAEQQLGPPPVPYAWLVFGSQARQEQSLHSDQDNALVLANDYRPEHDTYFESLARFVSDGLAACGFRYCPGEVMATNPRWRVPLSAWRSTFEDWVLRPEPEALMNSTIFFDMRFIRGEARLARELHQQVLWLCSENRIFAAHLARSALEHRPPLGFFRKFVLEPTGDHKETFDLKHRGLVPIIDLARVYALSAGLSDVNTRDRLARLAEAGELSEDGAANLQGALEVIAFVRLRHQAAQLRRGQSPDNFVSPEELSPFERRHLKDAFGVVGGMQGALAQRFPNLR